MTERIYVSDADVQSASDFEAIRIERRLVEDLSSAIPGRRKKILERIRYLTSVNPIVIVPILLRYYNHGNSKVRAQVRELIADLWQLPGGEAALIESLFSSHPAVANSAAELLDSRGLEGKKFREIYESTEELFLKCSALEISMEDIKELVAEAANLYRDKALEQGFENLILARDLLKDRLDWNENLRKYIKDVLKITPDLSHGGVQVDNIQDALKALSSAVKKRDYRETRELIESKKIEAAIRRELSSAFSYLSKRISGTEDPGKEKISEEDKWIFDAMKIVSNEIFDALKKKNRYGAMKSLHTFITHDFTGRYLEEISPRIEAGDEQSLRAARDVILGMAMIVNLVLPNIASDIYDTYLSKEISAAETVDDVKWPTPLKALGRKRK